MLLDIAGGVAFTVNGSTLIHPAGNVYVMFKVPAVTPVTTPEVELTVALALLALHVPPLVELVSVLVDPTHTFGVPAIAAGVGLTVNGVVTKQPVGKVNVMFNVPAATPVTIPVPEPTVANEALLLLHVLLPEPFVKVVVNPTHTFGVPLLAEGVGFTVDETVLMHPVAMVYVQTHTPFDTPVAIPVVAPIVAIPVLLLLQVPPPVALAKVVVEPVHKVGVPVIAAGLALMVTTAVIMQPVGNV
jgi:hypothetical protein